MGYVQQLVHEHQEICRRFLQPDLDMPDGKSEASRGTYVIDRENILVNWKPQEVGGRIGGHIRGR